MSYWAIPDNNEPPPMEDIGIPYFFFTILHWNPYLFRQFCIGIHTFSVMFLEFLTFVCRRFGKFRHFSDMIFGISYYFQLFPVWNERGTSLTHRKEYRGHWNSRLFWSCLFFGFLYLFQLTYSGRYRGHWNSRHFWSCLYSGFVYLFPLTYSGRYRGHWNSIQFCIHVIEWFWMLLETRQYNQHDIGREKLLCEYELMKT